MTRLWIDDLRDPKEWKPEWFREGCIWAKTAEEAINCFRTNNITEVSFDHDLGETEDCEERFNNGYEVSEWIEEAAYFGIIKRVKWFVHSANPVGAANIERAMKQADKYWTADECPFDV